MTYYRETAPRLDNEEPPLRGRAPTWSAGSLPLWCQWPCESPHWWPTEIPHSPGLRSRLPATTSPRACLHHPERLALCDHDDRVMQQAVEHRCGGRVLRQEASPLLERPVRRDPETAPFVGRRDEAEQQLGAVIIERREAKLVDDDEIEAQQRIDDLADGVVGESTIEGLDQLRSAEVAHAHAVCHRGVAGGDQEMLFPVPAGPMRQRFSCALTHSSEQM